MKRLIMFLALATTFCIAEESKGLWQRFVDFFSPSSSVEGNSAIEQDIKKLDKKIQTTKNDFNREHRPQRKSMLKKELEDLTRERDSLITVFENQKNSGTALSSEATSSAAISSIAIESSSAVSSSSAIESSSAPAQIGEPTEAPSSSSVAEIAAAPQVIPAPAEQCDTVWVIQKKTVHDTIFVHDTVTVHDTVFIKN